MPAVLVHQPALTPSVLRISFLEVIIGILHVAAAAGGEHVEGLAAQVVGFDEGVDDSGGGVPPHGEADPHSVDLISVFSRRQPRLFLEQSREMLRIFEAEVVSDFRH